MFHDVISYLAIHPVVFGVLLLFLVLAGVGGWYVIANYIQVLLVTMLCAAGFASGVLVLVRGVKDASDVFSVCLLQRMSSLRRQLHTFVEQQEVLHVIFGSECGLWSKGVFLAQQVDATLQQEPG